MTNKCQASEIRIAENNPRCRSGVIFDYRPHAGTVNEGETYVNAEVCDPCAFDVAGGSRCGSRIGITLVPAVKLQIGDRDNYGNYWDGGRWRDHEWWGRHYDWRDNHWRAHEEHRHDHHDDRDRGPDRDWRHH